MSLSEAESNCRLILNQLYSDIRTFSANSKGDGKGVWNIPSATCFEILHGLTHLCVAADLPKHESPQRYRELEKAERHFFRAALDYYKYSLFSQERIFTDDAGSFAIFRKLYMARAEERDGIGNDSLDKLSTYSMLLRELTSPPLQEKHVVGKCEEIPSLNETDNTLMNSFRLYRRVDAVYTMLSGFVYAENIRKAITAYFNNSRDDLDALSHGMMGDINLEVMTRFPKLMKLTIINDPHMVELYESCRGNEKPEEIRCLFDLFDAVLAGRHP